MLTGLELIPNYRWHMCIGSLITGLGHAILHPAVFLILTTPLYQYSNPCCWEKRAKVRREDLVLSHMESWRARPMPGSPRPTPNTFTSEALSSFPSVSPRSPSLPPGAVQTSPPGAAPESPRPPPNIFIGQRSTDSNARNPARTEV